MASADELRAFVRRDWSLLASVKRRFWLERRRQVSAAESLRIADDLRQQMKPPTPLARDADLAHHIRMAELLYRAAPTQKR